MTDRYEKIRRALAMGPTPGQWWVWDADSEPYITALLPENEGRRWNDPTICRLYDDVTPSDSVTFDPWLEAMPNAPANGSFIAACDPDTIRELLAERDRLAAALRDCYKLAYNCHRDELPTAIIMTASKAITEYAHAIAAVMEGRNVRRIDE